MSGHGCTVERRPARGARVLTRPLLCALAVAATVVGLTTNGAWAGSPTAVSNVTVSLSTGATGAQAI